MEWFDLNLRCMRQLNLLISVFSSVQSHGVVAIQWISSIIWQPILSKIARDARFMLFTHAVTPVPNSAICLKIDTTTNAARPRLR